MLLARAIRSLLLLLPLLLTPLPTLAQPAGSDMEASYRFLVSERTQGGILYTATAGTLQGRQLPLSFHDSAASWGEHICSTADCAVIDSFNPQTYPLTPQPSAAGVLQSHIEKILGL